MKKPSKKLKLGLEMIRNLAHRDLRAVAGGFPTESELASGCTVGSHTCSASCAL